MYIKDIYSTSEKRKEEKKTPVHFAGSRWMLREAKL